MQSNSGKQKASRQKGGKWQVGKQCEDDCIEPLLASGTAKMEMTWPELV